MEKIFATALFRLCGSILAVTALAKIVSLFTGAEILKATEPITNLTYLYFLGIVSGLELALVRFLFSPGAAFVRALALAVFSSIALAYRVIIRHFDHFYMCPCLGTATEWLPIPPEATDTALFVTILAMFAGSMICIVSVFTKSPLDAHS
jgi:hypothetical protein